MKVAILGTWHVHTKEYTTGVLNNPNAEVAVVWDNDAERGKKFADEMNLPFNADLDAVLGDESIDSVVICTATCDHPEVMMKVTGGEEKHLHREGAHHRPQGRREGRRGREGFRQGIYDLLSAPHVPDAARGKSFDGQRQAGPCDLRTRAQRTQRQLCKLASPAFLR